jgi:BirA family biotin operon repressor/biotin-[acetyl-CoA-carboxylase] ligase
MTERLRGAWLRRHLPAVRIQLFARLGSTQLKALHDVEAGRLTAPALLVAARQTAGHGQRTNLWWSDGGSLCATLVRTADPALPLGQVPLRAGLAVANLLAALLPGRAVHVKWPNDILIEGHKVAGLLCARRRGLDIIGLGLNVRTRLGEAPAAVQANATSLHLHIRHPPRRDELLVELWSALDRVWAAPDSKEQYQRRLLLVDQRVQIDDDGTVYAGICRGVDDQGRLLLQSDLGWHVITNGTVYWGPHVR